MLLAEIKFIQDKDLTSDVFSGILESFQAKKIDSDYEKKWQIDFYLSNKKNAFPRLIKLNPEDFSTPLSSEDFVAKVLKFLDSENEKILKKLSAENLSQTENIILLAIYKSYKSGIFADDLLKLLGYNSDVNSHTIQSHIHSIRKKTNKNLEIKNGRYFII